MIRVNLLTADRPTKQKKASSAPSAPGTIQLYLFLFVFVGGALAVCALLWFMITSQIADLDSKIDAARKRQAQLQQIKKQVEDFQAQEKVLQAKVDLIQRLRLEQGGPVHMLDELSKALPDLVWLNNLDQNGNNIVIKGETNSYNAIADFIKALERSGWFPSVELRSSTEQNSIVTFELSATFLDPSIAAKQAAAAATAAPAGQSPAPAPGKK